MFTLPSSIPATKAAAAAPRAEVKNEDEALADIRNGWLQGALDQLFDLPQRVQTALDELKIAIELAATGDQTDALRAVQLFEKHRSELYAWLQA